MGGCIDMTNQRFGRLTVIERAENSADGKARWRCRCDCGSEITVIGKDLRSGNTKSCGCYHSDKAHEARLSDLVGKRFGRLVVLRREPFVRGKQSQWACRCDCGRDVVASSKALLSGDKKSCGCLKRDSTAQRNKERSTTHGGSHDRLFKVWQSMKNRCKGVGNDDNMMRNYFFRGITVCDEWRDDYSAFRDWAYASGYNDNAAFGECTIDRVDPDGDYCPENCRWVSMKVQQNNRRNNRIITIGDETHTLSEWCSIYGKTPHLVSDRLSRGWSIHRALTEPVHEEKRHK